MKGHPLVFTHAADPLEAEDWLCAMEKQLNIAQCNDLEKVLYASGQLRGAAQDWWESFQYGHRLGRIQGELPVLSHPGRVGGVETGGVQGSEAKVYVWPNDVAEDHQKQHLFLKGLYDGLQLRLMSNTYPNFHALVNHAIVIDNKRKEMEAKKRRFQG